MKKEVTTTQAKKFCKALLMVEYQIDVPTTKIKPLEIGQYFGHITNILFEANNIQYRWNNLERRIRLV